MNNKDKPVIIPPNLIDLINFGQFVTEFEIPYETKDSIVGSAVVRMALLWQGDILEVLRKSAQFTEVNDTMTRNDFIAVETLVASIESFAGNVYVDRENKTNHEHLKGCLRLIINKLAEPLVHYMYWCYLELASQRNKMMAEVLEPFKKKFQENLKSLTLDYKLI